jgi:NDP-sugar pyrophosphorylase family protein
MEIIRKINVVIPMAGRGTRFENEGFSIPKPLISVNGKRIIERVVENLNLSANYIFVVQEKHRKIYDLDSILKNLVPDCKIVSTNEITEGTACTVLLAKHFINNDNPILICNSDQVLEWDANDFVSSVMQEGIDGGIVTFKSSGSQWSFAQVLNGVVTRVAEKNPISENATAGIYWWDRGSDFVILAEEMIRLNDRTNGEFYVCPVYNYAINEGLKIVNYEIEKFWNLGTPKDLEVYLLNHNV